MKNSDANENIDIRVNYVKKHEIIKLQVAADEKIAYIKKKLSNLLLIDFNSSYDLLIENFALNAFFDNSQVSVIIKTFSSEDFKLEEKTCLLSNLYSVEELSQKYLNLMTEEIETDYKIKESERVLIDLSRNERTLTHYYHDLSVSLSITMNGTQHKFDDESEFVDLSNNINLMNSRLGCLKEEVKNLSEELSYKNVALNEKIKITVDCKLNEQLSYDLIKSNETLTFQILTYEKTLDKYRAKIAKLESKCETLHTKLAKHVARYENAQCNKANNYYNKLRLQFSQLHRVKSLITLINSRDIFILNFNVKQPYKSDIVKKRFDDLCHFRKDQSEKFGNSKRVDVTLCINRSLIIIMKSYGYIYKYSSNEMKLFPNPKEDHEGGCLIYCSNDSYVYLISGVSSARVERIGFSFINNSFESFWSFTHDLNETRGHFSCFLVNSKLIYVILGYDYLNQSFCETIKRLDTSKSNESWVILPSNTKNCPKLCNAGIMLCSIDHVLIIGGLQANLDQNFSVYSLEYFSGEWGLTEFCVQNFLKNSVEDDKEAESSDLSEDEQDYLSKSNPMMFIGSTFFTALKFDKNFPSSFFYYAQFDSLNYCHIINGKTFEHLIVYNSGLHDEADNDVDQRDDNMLFEINSVKSSARSFESADDNLSISSYGGGGNKSGINTPNALNLTKKFN